MSSVTVITPIYNRIKYVEAMVNMLQAQTLFDIEFIVVDDGSTDGTFELLQKTICNDKRFILLKSQTNLGPSAARNLALQKANGKYIGFFDCDDKIPSNYFESLYRQAIHHNVDIVYTVYNEIRPKNKILKKLKDKISSLRNGALWDKLYKTSLIKENNLSFAWGLYCADNIFVVQSFYFAKNILQTNEPVYQYALNDDSIGKDKSKEEKRKADILTVIKIIQKLSTAYNFNKIEQNILNEFLIRSLLTNNYYQDNNYIRNINKLLNVNVSRKIISMKLGILKFARFFHILSKTKYNEKRQIEMVKHSHLFNNKWYLSQYPDVKAKRIGAAKHYIKYGWKEGRNPSLEFNTNWYLEEYKDVADAKICPLIHYITKGKTEGRKCSSDEVTNFCNAYSNSLLGNIKYVLEYPIRLQEKCERLEIELNELEKSLNK